MKTMKAEAQEQHAWNVLLEVPTRAETGAGRIKAMRRWTDFFDDMSDAEIEQMMNSEWITICKDGIIVWKDGM